MGVVALSLLACSRDGPPSPKQIHDYVAEFCTKLPQVPASDAEHYASLCAAQTTLDSGAPASTNTSAPINLDIYIDGSGSMRGFAVPENSNYRSLVHDLLEAASTSEISVNKYKFTSTTTLIKDTPVSEIQSPGFYNGADTPLAELVDRIAGIPNRTAIILSDLVQSERSIDWGALSESFRHLAETRPQIELLAFRSDFDSDYVPEYRAGASAGARVHLKLSQSIPNHGRPFYLLIIAPDTTSLNTIDKIVTRRIKPVETYDPTQLPVQIEEFKLAKEADLNDASLQEQTTGASTPSPGVPSNSASNLRSARNSSDIPALPWFATRRFQVIPSLPPTLISSVAWTGIGAQGDRTPLLVDLQIAEALHLHDPGGLSLDGIRLVWKRNQFTRTDETALLLAQRDTAKPNHDPNAANGGAPGNAAASAPQMQLPERFSLTARGVHNLAYDGDSRRWKGALRLAVDIPNPRPGSWDIYVIPIRPGISNLDRPSWIADWSTDDDSQPLNGNRTFELEALADCMVHAISEKSVIGEWYLITTQGGK
jgi:hypothetical protein